MRQVSKTEFFAAIGPRDVNPSHKKPNETEWKTRAGQIVGRTLPGWRNGYTDGKPTLREYFLCE
jgi:hypothetical protein